MHFTRFIWIFDDDNIQGIVPKLQSRGSTMFIATCFILIFKRQMRIKSRDSYMENLNFLKVAWCRQLYRPSDKRPGTWLKMEQRVNSHYYCTKLISQTISTMNKMSTANGNTMMLVLTYANTFCITLKTICFRIPNFCPLTLGYLTVWI